MAADPSDVGSDWLFDINQQTLNCDRFWTIFATVFHFSVLSYIIWRNNKSATIDGEIRLNNLLWKVTLTTIIVLGLNQLSSVFTVFPFDGADCFTYSIINTWLYFGSKFFLWTYNMIRLNDVFSRSGTLAYKVNFLKGLVVFFAFECILINVLHMIFDDAVNHYGLCVVLTADFIPGLFALIDIVSNVLCLWLFYRKMRQLWKMVSSISSESITEQQVELAYIIRKYTVLTAFSVVSTILLGASVAITPIFFTFLAWDSIINTVCLVLFDKRYDAVYKLMCCGCAKRIKFDEIIKTLRLEKEIQMTAEKGMHETVPSATGPSTTGISIITTTNPNKESYAHAASTTVPTAQPSMTNHHLSVVSESANEKSKTDTPTITAVTPAPEE